MGITSSTLNLEMKNVDPFDGMYANISPKITGFGKRDAINEVVSFEIVTS